LVHEFGFFESQVEGVNERVTYYAIVDDRSSRDEPAGVLRRVEDDEGERDEAFGRELR
jgi:hypothetical protein